MTLLTKPRSIIKPGVYNSLFDRFLGDDISDVWTDSFIETVPAVNIREKNDGFTIDMAVPGLKKSDFKIDVDKNLITISSEKETESKTEDKGFTKREYNYASFTRSFTLPDSANADKVTARYEDGVLRLAIPKKEQALKSAPKTVKVS